MDETWPEPKEFLSEAAHMMDAEWCPANCYVIYPVALPPRLERDSFDYDGAGAVDSCLRR